MDGRVASTLKSALVSMGVWTARSKIQCQNVYFSEVWVAFYLEPKVTSQNIEVHRKRSVTEGHHCLTVRHTL